MNINPMFKKRIHGHTGTESYVPQKTFSHPIGYLLLIFMILFCTEISAQTQSASGIVTDKNGEPLIGAIVKEAGTKNMSVTDSDGKFSLNISKNKAILVFTYLGYTEIQAPASAHMRIAMSPESKNLDEVVVVAYGAQKKETVTGSIASIDDKEIMKSSSPTVAAAIAGKIPGLTTLQSNGEPGRDNVTMYLRGVGTTNGATPLILVDGVPQESIRAIDANEIATLSVLKDASATAVFGVRGANGVILITTKRGEKGKATVHGSTTYSVQSFVRMPKALDSYTFATLNNEARSNEGKAVEFSESDLEKFAMWQNGGPTNPDDRYWYPNTNWQNIIFKDHASMTRTNVNISGGTDRVQYFVNAGYLYQGGMYNTESKKQLGYDAQSKMNRYNFRSNLDINISKWVKASVDLSSFIEKVNRNNGVQDAMWADALTARPTAPGPTTVSNYLVYDGVNYRQAKAGQVLFDPAQSASSSYGQLNRSGYSLATNSGVNATANATLDMGFLTPGLSLKGQVSFISRSTSVTTAAKSFVLYYYTRETNDEQKVPYYTFKGQDDEDGQISLSKYTNSNWFLNAQLQLNYDHIFGKKHDVKAMLLLQRDKEEKASTDLYYNMVGFSSRFTYAYDGRYMAEVNMGHNGSEQFSPDHRFGSFPALSVGWLVTNEHFFPQNNILNKMKLRASYGKVGNDKMGSGRFLYLDNISSSGSNYDYLLTMHSLGNGKKISISYIGNKNLQWETAWKQNYGIDLTLFKYLNLTFDYFRENRDNVLISRHTVPMIGGLTSSQLPRVNMGKVENHGYEATLNLIMPVTKNILWSLNGNMSYSKNKIKDFDEAIYGEDYAYRTRSTGYSVGQLWGYEIDYSKDMNTGRDGTGYFYSQESIKKSGLTYEIGNPLPGDFIYKDLNGDGKINNRDIAPIGYSSVLPRITFGFGTSIELYGFDISIMFQGVSKYSKYYSGWGIFEETGGKYFTDMHLNRWSAERYANGEKITSPRLANSTSTSHCANSYYIMDASYIRLKNFEVGYTLPKSITRKIKSENIRFYFSGDNLYTWTHLRTKSFDPEQNSLLTYPIMRNWNFGFNIQF